VSAASGEAGVRVSGEAPPVDASALSSSFRDSLAATMRYAEGLAEQPLRPHSEVAAGKGWTSVNGEVGGGPGAHTSYGWAHGAVSDGAPLLGHGRWRKEEEEGKLSTSSSPLGATPSPANIVTVSHIARVPSPSTDVGAAAGEQELVAGSHPPASASPFTPRSSSLPGSQKEEHGELVQENGVGGREGRSAVQS
jgi:hypothetical protein